MRSFCVATAITWLLCGVAPAQDGGLYEEDNGLIVVEFESTPPAGDWAEETVFTGFTFQSYYRWNGPDHFNSPGNGTVGYRLDVRQPGKPLEPVRLIGSKLRLQGARHVGLQGAGSAEALALLAPARIGLEIGIGQHLVEHACHHRMHSDRAACCGRRQRPQLVELAAKRLAEREELT